MDAKPSQDKKKDTRRAQGEKTKREGTTSRMTERSSDPQHVSYSYPSVMYPSPRSASIALDLSEKRKLNRHFPLFSFQVSFPRPRALGPVRQNPEGSVHPAGQSFVARQVPHPVPPPQGPRRAPLHRGRAPPPLADAALRAGEGHGHRVALRVLLLRPAGTPGVRARPDGPGGPVQGPGGSEDGRELVKVLKKGEAIFSSTR